MKTEKKFLFRPPLPLWEKIRHQAFSLNKSQNTLIVEVLDNYFKDFDKNKKKESNENF